MKVTLRGLKRYLESQNLFDHDRDCVGPNVMVTMYDLDDRYSEASMFYPVEVSKFAGIHTGETRLVLNPEWPLITTVTKGNGVLSYPLQPGDEIAFFSLTGKEILHIELEGKPFPGYASLDKEEHLRMSQEHLAAAQAMEKK